MQKEILTPYLYEYVRLIVEATKEGYEVVSYDAIASMPQTTGNGMYFAVLEKKENVEQQGEEVVAAASKPARNTRNKSSNT